MQKKIPIVLLAVATLSFLGCSKPSDPNEIRVGTIAGPGTQLVEIAKESAEKQGIHIKIVEFSDYTMPNTALNDGSIDANVFQHAPYLAQTIQNKHYDLVAIGKTFIYPMGIYAKHLKQVDQVTTGASIAIPNDPSNGARALLLLEKAGLIQLKKGAGTQATPLDIVSNPKQLKIKELDAAELPRILDDVELAVINSNYAISAGLSPLKNAIFLENAHSRYANLIVVRKVDEKNPKCLALIAALHSDVVLQTAKKLFSEDAAIPAWKK